jgi:hypothetical protein
MSLKSIELGGIVRNLPDNTVPDGSMQEAINIRPKDGAWRPVGPKKSDVMVPVDVIYIHKINSTTKVYLGHKPADFYMTSWVYVNDSLVSTNNTFYASGVGHDLQCHSMGNVLVILNKTHKFKEYLAFRPGLNNYLPMGEGLPEIPHFDITGVAMTYLEPDWFRTVVTTDKASILAEALKITNEIGLTEAGKPTGVYYIRLAWELVDGSIVRHTIPVVVLTSRFAMVGSGNRNLQWQGYHLKVSPIDQASYSFIKSSYKGVISSLNIR